MGFAGRFSFTFLLVVFGILDFILLVGHTFVAVYVTPKPLLTLWRFTDQLRPGQTDKSQSKEE